MAVVGDETIVPAPGEAIATPGGVTSVSTVTFTATDVVWLPAESRATAVRTCGPFPLGRGFHSTSNGAVTSSAPMSTPSTLNCTPRR